MKRFLLAASLLAFTLTAATGCCYYPRYYCAVDVPACPPPVVPACP